MTHDKAREYFSSYHEGTLEPGLRSSFERKLASDSALKSEYDSFVLTLGVLDGLRSEAIEIPAYLSSRIDARLEASAKPVSQPSIWATLFGSRSETGSAAPRFGWTLAVSAMLLVAAIGFRGMTSTEGQKAELLPISGGESVKWAKADGSVLINVSPASGTRVCSVLPPAESAQEFKIEPGQKFELKLTNPNAKPKKFSVSLTGDAPSTVIVPGRGASARKAGSGTIEDLAVALADTYRVSVVIKGTSASSSVRWSFDSSDPRTAAEQGLGDEGSATTLSDGVLQIAK